jgi:NitT/TauT family transport system permease protein
MPSVALEDSALPLPARARTRAAGRALVWRGQAPRALLVGAVSIAGWLALWELASAREWQLLFFRFENIPAPSQVLRAGAELVSDPKLGSHVWNSLRRIFAGFGVAAVLAVAAGLGIGRLRLARESLLPPLEVLRPVPAVAWIPLSILLFASAEESMVFITFIGAFFPILLNTIHGVEAIDSRLINASLTLGAGPVAVFREVILPGALPSIVTGLSIGMGTSWFSLVSAEMISGQFGIGYYTWEAYTLQNYENIVLGMVGIGVLGMGSSVLIKRIGRRCMPWFNPEANAR